MACKIYETLLNVSGGPLALGNVVRINGDSTMTSALATTLADVKGTIGVTLSDVPTGAPGLVLTNGKGMVTLEAGLAPVAGDTLWVSALTAGLATNIRPVIGAKIGIIKDATVYGVLGTVLADIDAGEGTDAQELICLSAGESAEGGTDVGDPGEVIYEWNVDFSGLSSSMVGVTLSLIGRAAKDFAAGFTAPVAVLQHGGTIGLPDGTPILVVPLIELTTVAEAQYRAVVAIPLPAGTQTLIKVVVVGGTDLDPAQYFAFIRGVLIQFAAL